MRVNYKGMDKSYNYRVAEINFDEKELTKVEYMKKAMKAKGWKIDIVTDGYALCEVDNKDEYNDFMRDWKEVKKERRFKI